MFHALFKTINPSTITAEGRREELFDNSNKVLREQGNWEFIQVRQ